MLKGGKQPYNLLLTPAEHAALHWLAEQQGISAAAVLRRALGAAVNHARNCPTCANGTNCYVPHMHQQRVPLPPAASLLSPHAPAPTAALSPAAPSPFAAFETGNGV